VDGLEADRENMFMSRHQNSSQSHNINVANESFENVAKFKYLETTVTNQNCIHKEIKSRFRSKYFSTHLLSKNIKTIILPILYGYETWSLMPREEYRLRVSENWVLMRMYCDLGGRK
jgi:dihydrofolate reductase